MQRYCKSLLTGKSYFHDDGIRILNIKQALYYIDNGVELLDLYPSRSYQTGEKILVFVFNKRQSSLIYPQWKENHTLTCQHFMDEKEDQMRVLNIEQVIQNMENKNIPIRVGPILDYRSHEPLLAFYFEKTCNVS